MNGNWSIASLSEEPLLMTLESNNKFIRCYLDKYSRSTSPEERLIDTMNRLLERSNPGVLRLQKYYGRSMKCEICEGKHTTTRYEVLNTTHISCLDFYASILL